MKTNIRPVPFDRQRALCEFYLWNVLQTQAVDETPDHAVVVEKNCLRCGDLFARRYASKSIANCARQNLKYCDDCA